MGGVNLDFAVKRAFISFISLQIKTLATMDIIFHSKDLFCYFVKNRLHSHEEYYAN